MESQEQASSVWVAQLMAPGWGEVKAGHHSGIPTLQPTLSLTSIKKDANWTENHPVLPDRCLAGELQEAAFSPASALPHLSAKAARVSPGSGRALFLGETSVLEPGWLSLHTLTGDSPLLSG